MQRDYLIYSTQIIRKTVFRIRIRIPNSGRQKMTHRNLYKSWTFFLAVLWIRDVYPGSRILIYTHPGSRISDPGSRIPDPKTATKERGEKKICGRNYFM
jgi:hypothetical protein